MSSSASRSSTGFLNPSLLRSATSPSGGKGKGASLESVGGNRLAPFLYPVDRGRGGSTKPRRSGGRPGTDVDGSTGTIFDDIRPRRGARRSTRPRRRPWLAPGIHRRWQYPSSAS